MLMFSHSDVNGETNGTWINIIDEDKYYIYTEIKETPPENEKRITFVKQKDGYYVFIGVYKLAECNENYPRKGMYQYVYTLESENYKPLSTAEQIRIAKQKLAMYEAELAKLTTQQNKK